MYQEERLLKILEYLNKNNSMSIHTICEMFGVARDTARRDIVKLIEQGAAVRSRGGISLPVLKNTIKNYRERLEAYSEEKKNIAKRALEFIEAGEHYFFDVSTTVSFLAQYVDKSITVFTHSLDNIEILSEKKDVKLYSMGGCFNKENRFFYNPDCMNYVKGVKFDVAFLGAAAITEEGIFYADEEDAYVKNQVCKNSSKVIVLAEIEKFNKLSYFKGLNLDEIDILVTDSMPPSEFVNIIKSNNIKLVTI
ncbi:DeoR/GlpR family DNA-binding transcription regulator [Clostridium hydrogenum]|uniref:DeoR/GlpR family DNA-binding transcription regulator n=1 Tax=Clostridium hydrogenum TaxID=2855764 RepID=UPI001F314C42|nr:DeoR/GlpR family DNA-binding transcription regulator [Clostridium hydrogenum]